MGCFTSVVTMMRSFIAVVASGAVAVHGVNVTEHWMSTSPTAMSDTITKELAAERGPDCAEEWNNVLASPAVQAASRSNEQFMSAILTALADQSMAKAKSVSVAVTTEHHQAHTTHHRSTAAVANAVSLDMACAVPALCKLKTLNANACNYKREALQQTYKTFNVAVHVFGIATRVLCGCVWAGDAPKCLLGEVPVVCGFPYQAYGQLWSQSTQLWEAVKQSTKTCNSHRA